jgi:hypothetical protein
MSRSKSFGEKQAAIPHLIQGVGGMSGEVKDLRNDIEEAFESVETPGHGGTGVLAVDEWVNPLAANATYVLGATVGTLAVKTVTTLLHATIPHARNLSIVMTAAGTFAGSPVVAVHGTDVNGAVLSENFVVANATVVGNKAFKTITSVVLPSVDGVIISALSITVGSGTKLGLGSKVKLRNGVAAVFMEMEDGQLIGGSIGSASTAVNQTANVTLNTESAHTHAITAATPAIAGVTHCGHASCVNPKAAELISIVNTVDCAPGAQILLLQPDYPRKLQLRMIEGGAAITVGTCTLVGVAIDGTAVTQVIDITGGTKTVVTDAVYATLTSATVSAITGGGAGTTISLGLGAALGLPIPSTATSVSVTKTCVDSLNETVVGVDATARAVAPTSAANAARDYDFYFKYVITGTQSAHDHGTNTGAGAAHTHTQTAAHNHTQNAHTHPGGGSTPGTYTIPAVGLPNGTYTPTVAPDAAHDYALVYERDLV